MIIFDLVCEQNHSFEGWFKSLLNFENQLGRGLISCPSCGSREIKRIPSTVHLGKTGKKESDINGRNPSVSKSVSKVHVVDSPATALAAMQGLIALITSQCEDVGREFAEEARRIHYAEAPERPIRGEVSQKEYNKLHEEGIDVLLLPRIKSSDLM